MPHRTLRRARPALAAVAAAVAALVACSDGGVGPVESLLRQRGMAAITGTWVYQEGDPSPFPLPRFHTVVADTIRLSGDGVGIWRVSAIDEMNGDAPIEATIPILWDLTRDTVRVTTSCHRDPACDTLFPPWIGTVSAGGALALLPDVRATNLTVRLYRKRNAR